MFVSRMKYVEFCRPPRLSHLSQVQYFHQRVRHGISQQSSFRFSSVAGTIGRQKIKRSLFISIYCASVNKGTQLDPLSDTKSNTVDKQQLYPQTRSLQGYQPASVSYLAACRIEKDTSKRNWKFNETRRAVSFTIRRFLCRLFNSFFIRENISTNYTAGHNVAR